jgi:hypothetical protein
MHYILVFFTYLKSNLIGWSKQSKKTVPGTVPGTGRCARKIILEFTNERINLVIIP